MATAKKPSIKATKTTKTEKVVPRSSKPAVVEQAEQSPKRAIRTTKAVTKGKTYVSDFVTFIRQQGVVGLAVGLVLGGAVSVLVKSLIDNVVMPPLGFLLGSADGLKGLTLNLGKTAGGKDAILNYGVFLNDFINFAVIALVVYLIVHLLKFDRLDKAKD